MRPSTPSRHNVRTPARDRHVLRPAAVLVLIAVVLASTAVAQSESSPGPVTPERLAAFVPARWLGIDAGERRARFDASGAATASGTYDDTNDGRSSRDLSMAITDLGPYRNATLLVERADVAEGRATEIDVGGYPGFAATDYGDPTLDVVVGRMWLRSRAFGELFGPDDLANAVKTLPLDAIAALSDAPLADGANYRPLGFTPGALRHFLPESVLGLDRGDGYYAKRHPTGVAWGGFPYVGTRDGHDVRIRLTIWDLGTLAADARRRLAERPDAWSAFTRDGRPGFVERGTPTPRILLDVGRFRLQVEARHQPGISATWLEGAFDDVHLDRLARLADLVPAPVPTLDPLAGQPDLLAPNDLAETLPASLAGMQRDGLKAEVASSRRDPFDTAYARATYRGGSGVALSVIVSDQGIVPLRVKEQLAALREVDVEGRVLYLGDTPPTATTVVDNRVVVRVAPARDSDPAPSEAQVRRALEALDLAGLIERAKNARPD